MNVAHSKRTLFSKSWKFSSVGDEIVSTFAFLQAIATKSFICHDLHCRIPRHVCNRIANYCHRGFNLVTCVFRWRFPMVDGTGRSAGLSYRAWQMYRWWWSSKDNDQRIPSITLTERWHVSGTRIFHEDGCFTTSRILIWFQYGK